MKAKEQQKAEIDVKTYHYCGVLGASLLLWNLLITILFCPVKKLWNSMAPSNCKALTCSLFGSHLADHYSNLEMEECSLVFTGQERISRSHSR